jgi:8-oxo-dGTP diphosphatase
MTGPALTFTAHDPAEAAALAALADDPEVARMTSSITRPFTTEMARARIARALANPESAVLGALRDGDGRLAGEGGFLGRVAPEILFWLGAPWRGSGLGHAALAAVLARVFAERAVIAARAECHADNAPSRAVLGAAGFLPDGAGLDADHPERGDPVRTLRFRLDRAAWEAVR